MEESIKDNLTSDIWDVLGLKSVSPRQLSPLVLAYIGDSIFDLVVKTKIVAAGNTQVNKMNRVASSIVKAESQSKMIGYLEDKLTEAELCTDRVVRDGNITTSRGLGTAIPFALELISQLYGKEKAEEIKKSVIYGH